MRDLADKLAVVTGAASGVGAALARLLTQEGMQLVLIDLDRARLTALAHEIGAPAIAVDVADADAMRRAADEVYADHDSVHLLVNNAGVMPHMAPIWELQDEELRRVLDVNVRGTVNGLRAFVPRMIEQTQPAHIVNTASEAAFASRGFVSGYHASKHAVLAVTEGLAQELGFLGAHIRVSVLCPGPVDTALMREPVELTNPAAERLWKVYVKSLERGLPPEDVARCVVDGVKEERFYLLPHPDVVALPAERAQAVAADSYPEFAENLAGLIRQTGH